MNEEMCVNDIPAEISSKECKQPRTEILRNWEINIKFLNIGCVVTVGCKSIAFSTIEEAMEAVNNHVKDPDTSRNIWVEKEQKSNNVN